MGSLPALSLSLPKTNDREGLQLTLDLIRDRKKDLEEQLEKWSIEQDEVKNELKLQGKMQEFLDGIRRMNEDSDFPSGNLKKSNLGNATGGKQRNKLEAHLNELQDLIEHGQASMADYQMTVRCRRNCRSRTPILKRKRLRPITSTSRWAGCIATGSARSQRGASAHWPRPPWRRRKRLPASRRSRRL